MALYAVYEMLKLVLENFLCLRKGMMGRYKGSEQIDAGSTQGMSASVVYMDKQKLVLELGWRLSFLLRRMW